MTIDARFFVGKPDYARFQYGSTVWTVSGATRVGKGHSLLRSSAGTYRFQVRAIGTTDALSNASFVVVVVRPFCGSRFGSSAVSRSAHYRGGFRRLAQPAKQIRCRRRSCAIRKPGQLEMQLQQGQKMDALGRLAGGIAQTSTTF